MGARVQDERQRGASGRKRCPTLRVCSRRPVPKPSDFHPEGPAHSSLSHVRLHVPGTPARGRFWTARGAVSRGRILARSGPSKGGPGTEGRTEGVGHGGRILGDLVRTGFGGQGVGGRPGSGLPASGLQPGGKADGRAAWHELSGDARGRWSDRRHPRRPRSGFCEVSPSSGPGSSAGSSFTFRPLVGSGGARPPTEPEGRSLGRAAGHGARALAPLPRRALRS